VFLRGINLGARNRVAMPELRKQLTGAGFEGVRTYLGSGNVVLDAGAAPGELERECKRLIQDAFGLDIAVVVRTRDELAAVVALDPLGEVATNPKRYQVSFMSGELEPAVLEKIEQLTTEPEQIAVAGRELYAWHPDGIARSKLWAQLAGQKLGVTATARNWTTVTNLLAMADE
jgi:uncharacterized protein (DUF1697 family)